LVGPRDEPHRHRRPPLLRDPPHDLHAGEDVQAPVEPAAVRHRVHVPADQELPLRVAAQREPLVPRLVDRLLGPGSVHLRPQELACALPRLRPRDPLRAVLVPRQRAQLLELLDGAGGVERHGDDPRSPTGGHVRERVIAANGFKRMRKGGRMTKLRLLFALAGTIALSMAAAAGVGAVGGPYVCSGGTPDNPTAIPAGTYPDGIVVTGNCLMTGDSTEVDGDLVVAPGAILNDHAASSTVVHVTGNAYGERHGVLGLGDYSPGNGTTVDGNVVARAPLSLYLGGMTVHGSLVSIGGGLGAGDFFRNLPLKDDVI